MFHQIIVLTIYVTFVSAGIVDYVICGSNSIVPNQLRVSGCEGGPCLFTKGSSYTIEMDATSISASNSLPYGFTITVSVPQDHIPRNVCNDLISGSCPIVAGQSFSFGSNYEVPSNFPQVDSRVAFMVGNASSNISMCVEFRVQIRNPQPQALN